MVQRVEIENIEELRRCAGVDDVALREAIRGLRVGDCVKLTFLNGGGSGVGETLLVRITQIRNSAFRGELIERPVMRCRSKPRIGSRIGFTTAHIHSLSGGD
jgi:hypothetical protein